MKNRGSQNVRKHREVKNGEKYITLEISLQFGSMENIKSTSLEPKDNWLRSRKGLITSMCLKTVVMSKEKKRQGMPLLMSI